VALWPELTIVILYTSFIYPEPCEIQFEIWRKLSRKSQKFKEEKENTLNKLLIIKKVEKKMLATPVGFEPTPPKRLDF
jgi:hypothetical protein